MYIDHYLAAVKAAGQDRSDRVGRSCYYRDNDNLHYNGDEGLACGSKAQKDVDYG